MKLRSFFLSGIISISALSSAVSAVANAEYQNISKLRDSVEEHVKEHFLNIDASLEKDVNLFIEVGQLDSRLKLQQCGEFLALKLNTPPHRSSQATVKATCDIGKRWTIYIPVKVDIYKEVIVAARDMTRGSLLSDEDFSFVQLSISSFGVGLALSSDADKVSGMELQRPLRAGSPINTKYLKKPNIVAKGDTVTLEAGSNTLNVSVGGVALDDGHLGKRIRVRNSQSKRVVDGLVVAPGKVTIAAH